MTPSLKPYTANKPSGVEWLGDIPEGWEVRKLKYLVNLLTQKVNSLEIKVGLENIESETGRYIESDSDFDGDGVPFRSGDILYGKLRPYLAKVLLVNMCGLAVGDFFVLRPLPIVSPGYLQYKLLDPMFTMLSNGSTFGAKMPRVGWDFMGNVKFSLPDLYEQNLIANYLDRETAHIDALIAEKERMLALLEEKRAALINHAVTRGLNPNVHLKPSGIEWLGDIPEGWEIRTLKRVSSRIYTGTTPTASYMDGTLTQTSIWYTPGDFQNGRKLTDSKRRIPIEAVEDKVAKVFPPNSIMVIGIGATLGKVATSPVEFSANQQINVILPSDAISYEFLLFVLQGYENIFHAHANSATLAILNQERLGAIQIPFPPLEEQILINSKIKEKQSAECEIKEELSDSISLLKERRSALITAAVTGQIKIGHGHKIEGEHHEIGTSQPC